MPIKLDPEYELYQSLREPFESEAEARAALQAFAVEVAKLREQYRIPDLSLNGFVFFKGNNGDVCEMATGIIKGRQVKALEIARDMLSHVLAANSRPAQADGEQDGITEEEKTGYVN
jgi:hypothetical protein